MASIGNSRYLYRAMDIAKIYNVPTRTLKSWREEGIGFPFRKVGNEAFYILEEIDNYVRKHLNAPDKKETSS